MHLNRLKVREDESSERSTRTGLPTTVICFLDEFNAYVAHLKLLLAHRKAALTTNLLDRLFGEEGRRTKMIPHDFGERRVLKLMYAALIRARGAGAASM